MGVWHPRWNAGVVHYADYGELPGKKIWSLGRRSRRPATGGGRCPTTTAATSRSRPGLFRNQETYAFLPPQTTTRFSEYWMPVRNTGGISRANLHGVVFMNRQGGKLHVALNVNHVVPDATVRVVQGTRVLTEAKAAYPRETFTRDLPEPERRKCTFELLDKAGKPLLAHTEDTYDWTPESEIKPGPQAEQDPRTRSRSERTGVERRPSCRDGHV